MTIEELYQAARLRVRKAVSDDLDADVRRVADTAIADMKRIGIDDSWLSNPSSRPTGFISANTTVFSSSSGFSPGCINVI